MPLPVRKEGLPPLLPPELVDFCRNFLLTELTSPPPPPPPDLPAEVSLFLEEVDDETIGILAGLR